MGRRVWKQEWRIVIKFEKVQPSGEKQQVCVGVFWLSFHTRSLLGVPSIPSPRPALNGSDANPLISTILNVTANSSDKDESPSFLSSYPPSTPAPYPWNNYLLTHLQKSFIS